MELIPIGKEKLEISLTKKDMERFRLTAERLDYKNTETRRAVWEILDTAKQKTGFDAAAGKIRIDALPSKSGGCVIFITKTEEKMNGEKTLSADTEKVSETVYGFRTLSDLLHVCLFLSVRGYSGGSSVFMEYPESRTKNRYYLTLSRKEKAREKRGSNVFENMFIGEFGKKIGDERAVFYINEHCECLCPENAVDVLSDMA